MERPDKTFIGRIERGFDFLGCHFGPEGITVAAKTIEQFVARATRLYEQEPGEAFASARFGRYVQRWVRWARTGLPITAAWKSDAHRKSEAAVLPRVREAKRHPR